MNRVLSNSCLWNRALFFLSRCIELDITGLVIWLVLVFKNYMMMFSFQKCDQKNIFFFKGSVWNVSFSLSPCFMGSKNAFLEEGEVTWQGRRTPPVSCGGAEKGTRTLDTCLGKAILYHWAISAEGLSYTKSPVKVLGLFLPFLLWVFFGGSL